MFSERLNVKTKRQNPFPASSAQRKTRQEKGKAPRAPAKVGEDGGKDDQGGRGRLWVGGDDHTSVNKNSWRNNLISMSLPGENNTKEYLVML